VNRYSDLKTVSSVESPVIYRRYMDNLISVPFLRVLGVRCQFIAFSSLFFSQGERRKPDTRNLIFFLM